MVTSLIREFILAEDFREQRSTPVMPRGLDGDE